MQNIHSAIQIHHQNKWINTDYHKIEAGMLKQIE